MDEPYEILIFTIRKEQDLTQFFNTHFRRHHPRNNVVRIAGIDAPVRHTGLLREKAKEEMANPRNRVTLSCRNLPPTSVYAANRCGYNRTTDMELRLHVQRPGEPDILQVIIEQEQEDWEKAKEYARQAGRPVPEL